LEAEAEAQAVNVGTQDAAEAMLAFVERHEPRFEGPDQRLRLRRF
jgi:hypothetical protein